MGSDNPAAREFCLHTTSEDDIAVRLGLALRDLSGKHCEVGWFERISILRKSRGLGAPSLTMRKFRDANLKPVSQSVLE